MSIAADKRQLQELEVCTCICLLSAWKQASCISTQVCLLGRTCTAASVLACFHQAENTEWYCCCAVLCTVQDKILKLLRESEGNILDDEQLLNTLNNSKRTSAAIQVSLHGACVQRGQELLFQHSSPGSTAPTALMHWQPLEGCCMRTAAAARAYGYGLCLCNVWA